MSYRVELPVFSGPLDLLLHLVKQSEVDIHKVRIADILDRYLEHIKVLETLDLADIGEFIVLASTLMEIKSRELLPSDEVVLEDELDPRDNLIQQLLEYKRYRDLSRRLERFARRRTRMAPVAISLPTHLAEDEAEADYLELGEIELWDLTDIFARLLEETGNDKILHVGIDRRNISYYVDRVLDRVRGGGDVEFETLFEASEGRYGMIGTFQVILELMKQGFMRAYQREPIDSIVVQYSGPADLSSAQVSAGVSGFDDAALEAELEAKLDAEESSEASTN